MGFFSAVKRIFGGVTPAGETGGGAEARSEKIAPALLDAGAGNSLDGGGAALTLRLREAEPRLSAWLAVILEGVDTAGALF
ncbi:MAG: signal recognition particle-docking protein FtsY, partial [Desulfovibrio sp.]|nr:signal recognition particle-docking protein FtsY [Desulfovibrio sp.]